MDIYEYADSINYDADYYDFHTGYIYKIQDYGRDIKASRDNPDDEIICARVNRGIAVYEGDALIGYAQKRA